MSPAPSRALRPHDSQRNGIVYVVWSRPSTISSTWLLGVLIVSASLRILLLLLFTGRQKPPSGPACCKHRRVDWSRSRHVSLVMAVGTPPVGLPESRRREVRYEVRVRAGALRSSQPSSCWPPSACFARPVHCDAQLAAAVPAILFCDWTRMQRAQDQDHPPYHTSDDSVFQ